MHLEKLDVPQALIEAQQDGQLVVFAGAGVSKGPPSCLPGFPELTEQIAEGTHIDRGDRETFERYLGRLHREGDGVDVHGIAKSILTDPDSEPTKLHRELLKLFPSPSKVRLVTTNFDEHFSTAADDVFDAPPPHYFAPALPLGHDFNGIAYLHGSVTKQKGNLVLTDRDFGEAYLTEGWARRFLQKLFQEYHVLFVGYSHSDDIVNYLARGLPPSSGRKRFALAKGDGWEGNEETRTDWRFLGVEPIHYPKAEGNDAHAFLPEGVARWNAYTRLSASDHEERIKEFVAKSPELNVEAQDYLRSALREEATTRFFKRHASDPEWLHWANAEGLLDPLFRKGEVNEPARILAEWIAHQFVCDHPEDALVVVGPHAHELNTKLWYAIASQLWQNRNRESESNLPPDDLSKWLHCLLDSPPDRQEDLELLLQELTHPEDREPAILLFDHFLRPIPQIGEGYGHLLEGLTGEVSNDFQSRLEVTFHAEHYTLEDMWESLFKPNLGDYAAELGTIATHHLRRAHRLFESTKHDWDLYADPISLSRSAIEPHEQDKYPEPEDLLIDVARDILEWHLAHGAKTGHALIARWVRSGNPLLKRIALHGITESEHWDADEKMDWLLERDWLYTTGLKHEVFRLLETAYPEAGRDTRTDVLNAVCSRLDEIEDGEQRSAYSVFNLLYWLAQAAPACDLAASRLAEVEDEHPKFEPREHPDLDFWIGGVQAVGDPSEDVLALPPERFIKRILSKSESGGFQEVDAFDTVRSYVAQDFERAYRLVNLMIEKEEGREDFWPAALNGLRNASLTEKAWEKLLGFLEEHPELNEYGGKIAFLLEARSHPEKGDLPLSLLEKAEAIADSVWERLDQEAEEGDGADISVDTAPLNYDGGKLAGFYLNALWKRRAQANDEWEELPEGYQERFERILTGSSSIAQVGQMRLAARASFLLAVDVEWTRQNVISLFDWESNPQRAPRV